MSSGTPPRPSAGLMALATAAAVVSVVMVLVSGAVAGQKFATRDSNASADDPVTQTTAKPPVVDSTVEAPTSTVFPDGQLVIGDALKNAYFEVPAQREGWDYRDTMILGLEVKDSYAGILPKIQGAAYYDASWCGTKSLPTGRAYFGFTGPIGTNDVRTANQRARDSWAAGLSYDLKKGDPGPRTTSPRRVTTADGTTAYVSSVTGRMNDGECPSDKLKVTVLSIDTGKYVATVVGHEYLDTGKDLSEPMVMKVLTSVRAIEK
jgi:hypothetical protein